MLRDWALRLKRDVVAIYLAGRDPRVAWPIKLLALAVSAYALSPIDLIPDFISVIGMVDDLILVPLGLLAVIRLLPFAILEEHRARAVEMLERPTSRVAGALILAVWVLAVVACGLWLYRLQWDRHG
ncbi:YkvA family protein [Brevundimonas sp. TWP2-3-4b1]|uniref:YkvA family protein n=1 Tax=Brevundimonas sp. TWP2-3-4b1 TaxID=2804580 RepID=UPI003CEF075D